jgi:hypothetical protein
MVSVGNKAELVNSTICQKCAKCCKEFVCGGWNFDSAIRMMWTQNKDIKVRDSQFRDDFGEIKREVIFKTPCSKLVYNHGRYSCSVWDRERPDFCNTYPDSIFYCCDIWDTQKIEMLLKEALVDCPGLKEVTVEQVQKMLEKHRLYGVL